MSGGGSKPIVNETARISALRIQTSCYGVAVPVVLGRQRCTGNMIYYDDLQAIRHEEKQAMGGGKGGGGAGGMTNVSYTYRYSLQIGICEGPVTVGNIWMQTGNDKMLMVEHPEYGYTIYPGNTPNGSSGVLASRHADQFFAYPGLANMTCVDLGEFTGDTPPSFSFEVFGIAYDATINGADPAQAIAQIITNARWGAAAPAVSFPVASGYGDYAVAMGWSLGLEMSEQKQAADWVQDILDQTNAAPVWAADHLDIVPYGDTAISANGRIWTPNVTPIYDLTDDDYIGDVNEPVRVERKADSESYNIQTVEFRNQANEYNIETIDGSDPASVAMYGPKKNKDTLSARGLRSPDAASRLAEIRVQRTIRTRNGYEFDLPWTFCRLLPMDIVTLTDAALGLDRYPVRLTKVTETADMVIQCAAEDFPAGAGHAALIPRQTGSGYAKDYNAAPGNSATPVIFEPPTALSGTPEIWLGTAGGDNWGGANVYMSLDNISFRLIGRVPGRARIGVTTSALPYVADPDSTSVLGVNLSISHSTLIGCSAVDRDAYATLSYIGGELISYQNAALTGINAYGLSSLRRGAYGSPIAAHASAAKFMRLDESVFKYPYDPDLIGKTVYLKLQSYNLFGGAVQDLETLPSTSYLVQGAPMGVVSGLALAQPFDGGDCAIKWSASKSAATYTVEVWVSNVKRRTVTGISSTAYTYSFETNKADGGPARTIEFRLYAIAKNGASSSPAVLTATNPQMGAPSAMNVSGSGPVLYVLSSKPAAVDYAGTKVWISAVSGFNPLATTPAYEGPEWTLESTSKPAGRYYVRMAHYDIFGTDGLSISSEIMVDYIGDVGGIAQVDNAAALTTLTSDAFWAVYDKTTKKIWTWNPATNRYVSQIQTADLVGKIQDTQLSDALSAPISRIPNIESALSGVAAGLTNEQTARASGDSALSQSIATVQASLSGGPNLLPNAGFDIDTAGWLLGWEQVPSDDDGTMARDLGGDPWRPTGMHTIGLVRAGSPTGSRDINSEPIAIEPGGRYCVSGWIASHRCASSLFIIFLNAAKDTQIEVAETTTTAATGGPSLSGWDRKYVFGTAPSNAAYAYVIFRQHAATAANPYSWLCRPQLEKASPAQLTPSAWSPSSSDIAAVKVESSATASKVSGLQAKWGVQVQTMADGKRAMAGLSVNASTDSESSIAVLADKFIVYQPDGSASKQIFTLGTVNGQTKLVLVGDLLADGSILAKHVGAGTMTADKMSVTDLSAISANLGHIQSASMDIYGNNAGGYGYTRSYGKWWLDGNNGWILARDPSGGSFMEFKGGTTQFRLSSWGDNYLNFNDRFIVAADGTVNIKSAAGGARLEIKNDVIKVFDAAGTLRVQLGDFNA